MYGTLWTEEGTEVLVEKKTVNLKPGTSVEITFLEYFLSIYVFLPNIRVAKVVTVHNDLSTQWRPMKMSKFRANIFLIQSTSNWCQNWDQWHKMSGKNINIYFFYFWFKNKRVWAEKIGKNQKNFKNLKVAGNCRDI